VSEQSRKKMRHAVAYLTGYMIKYVDQQFYADYPEETFINDVLYGLGVALDDKYSAAQGFDEFKKRLREHLGKEAP
jgi:hypothetical protein